MGMQVWGGLCQTRSGHVSACWAQDWEQGPRQAPGRWMRVDEIWLGPQDDWHSSLFLFQSALGFEYKGEVEKHSSQKGKSMGMFGPLMLTHFLFSWYPVLSAVEQPPLLSSCLQIPILSHSALWLHCLLSCNHLSAVYPSCLSVMLCCVLTEQRGHPYTHLVTNGWLSHSFKSPSEKLLQRVPNHCRI